MRKYLSFGAGMLMTWCVAGQDIDRDNRYQEASLLAKNKKYASSIELCSQLLSTNNRDFDTRFLLSRVLAWNESYHMSMYHIDTLINQYPNQLEPKKFKALILFWSGQLQELEHYSDSLKSYFTNDPKFIQLRAISNEKVKDLKDAKQAYSEMLEMEKTISSRLPILQKLMNLNRNYVSVFTTHDHFATIDPWKLIGIDYSRKFEKMTWIGRFNHAKRFGISSYQFEIEGYPKITKSSYLYINYGISDGKPIFPTHRIGFQYYHSLPSSFEVGIGLRYLEFQEKGVTIYAASINKYLSGLYLSLSPFYIIDDQKIIQSYHLFVKKTLTGSDHYVGLHLGVGQNPDQGSVDNNLLNDNSLFQNMLYRAVYQHPFHRFIIRLELGQQREEVRRDIIRDRLSLGLYLIYGF